MDEASKKKYIVIIGGFIIILIASLLFIARDRSTTVETWIIISSVLGFLCGVAFLKKDYSKIAGILLAIICAVSLIMIGATYNYWMHVFLGLLVPPMLAFIPPLATLAGIIIGVPLLNLILSLISRSKKQKNQNKIPESDLGDSNNI